MIVDVVIVVVVVGLFIVARAVIVAVAVAAVAFVAAAFVGVVVLARGRGSKKRSLCSYSFARLVCFSLLIKVI